MRPTLRKLKEFFSLDYRSLALMRFGMGLLILLDLIDRAHSLTAHYSDAGTLSRTDLITLYGNRFLVSVHMLSGLTIVEATLFVLAGIFAVMLMLGWRTRLATAVSWFLLISLQARNPMVLQGGDIIFRVTLFWMIFLPTGARWSLDRLFGRTARATSETVASATTVGYVTQIVLFYLLSGLLKTGAAWHDGTAVYYALSVDQLVRPLGEHLRTWLDATKVLTRASRLLEIYGSLLYFSPWKTGLFRTHGVLLFALMQVGFNLSLHLGRFGAISIAVTLALLPPYFWDSWIKPLTARLRNKAPTGLRIYYDGACGFCYKTVYILRNFLLLSHQTLLAPAHENAEAERLMAMHESWVVMDARGSHTGFQGVVAVFRASPVFFWLAPLFALPGIRHVGQWVYKEIAARRLTVCLPEPTNKHAQTTKAKLRALLLGASMVFLTMLIIVWNVEAPWGARALKPVAWVGWTLRLDQRFDMFAPTPLTEDGWYVIPATLRDGTRVDLFKNGPMLTKSGLYPISYQKPAHIADGYPDQRWQKYLMNIAEADNSRYRLAYGQYLCRTWNAHYANGETLETFNLEFMIENTPPPGAPNPDPVRVVLWEHRCF